MENFTTPGGYQYPVFREGEVEVGELLFRVGYPFLEDMKPTWENGAFKLGNLIPIPIFVNEALVSRFVKEGSGEFMETSSPGLRGQSGGPIADANGFICGMQSHTHHYDLGFEGAGQNQVLNVGRATNVKTIRKYLDKHDVDYMRGG